MIVAGLIPNSSGRRIFFSRVNFHQGMDRPGVHQVPEGSGEQGKMEETGRKIICGAPVALAVKGDDGDDNDGSVLRSSNSKQKQPQKSTSVE